MRCLRWRRRSGLFYVLQIFLWTASFSVNTEIVAWSTVRRILLRFLTCVRHAFFSVSRSCPGYVLKVYYWWRTCLWLAFRKQFVGKADLKINLLVKTPLHRRSMEVRRSGLWAPGQTGSKPAKKKRFHLWRWSWSVPTKIVACSRRSDSGVRREGRNEKKNKKKKDGEGERRERLVPSLSPYPTPSLFFFCSHLFAQSPQSERLEQAS